MENLLPTEIFAKPSRSGNGFKSGKNYKWTKMEGKRLYQTKFLNDGGIEITRIENADTLIDGKASAHLNSGNSYLFEINKGHWILD